MKRLPKRNLAQMQRRARQHQADKALVVQPLATSCGSLQSLAEQSSDSSISTVLPHQIEDGFLVDILEDRSYMLLEHLDMNYGPPSWMSFVPLTDDQMATRHQVGHSQGLAWNRHQALQSALSVASQLLGGMEKCTETAGETANNEEQHNVPSLEFLYWMLNGIVDPYRPSLLWPETYSFVPFKQTFAVTSLAPLFWTFSGTLANILSSIWGYPLYLILPRLVILFSTPSASIPWLISSSTRYPGLKEMIILLGCSGIAQFSTERRQ